MKETPAAQMRTAEKISIEEDDDTMSYFARLANED
jgi:hypothetical protein